MWRHPIPRSLEIVGNDNPKKIKNSCLKSFVLGDFEEDAVGVVEVAEHLVAGVVRDDRFRDYDGIAEELYSGVPELPGCGVNVVHPEGDVPYSDCVGDLSTSKSQ